MSREELPNALADDNREPSVSDVLEAIGQIDGPGVTASEIGIVLGCSQDTARRRLEELSREGYVQNQKKSQQTLWWRPDRERKQERDAVSRYSPAEGPETNAVELLESSEDDT